MVRNARMWPPQRRWICGVKPTPVANDKTPIKKFILDTLLASGARKQWSIASQRGRGALRRHYEWMVDSSRQHHEPSSSSAISATAAAVAGTLKALEDTITSGADLPTSLLILHIATDICYYYEGTTSSPDDQVAQKHGLLHLKKVKKHKQISRELSNYIMYLVFKCSVMLTTNSQILHDKALDEIERIVKCKHGQAQLEEKDAVMKVFEQDSVEIEHMEADLATMTSAEIQVEVEGYEQDSVEIEHMGADLATMTSAEIQVEGYEKSDKDHMGKLLQNNKTLSSPVLPRARAVAEELIGIKDEAARWLLIAEVWAEMLYYAAPRCGGGFHYEHLSQGGEFATHVLALMYYLGPFMPPPDA